MDESGAGNGYGAYWVYFNAPILTGGMPLGATCKLQENFIRHMAQDILVARTTSRENLPTVDLAIGTNNGAIQFDFGKLPSRRKPRVGDMCRVLKSKCTQAERVIGDGRVVGSSGRTIKVISSWDEGDDGKPRPNACVTTVNVTHAMKINDWLKEHRARKGVTI